MGAFLRGIATSINGVAVFVLLIVHMACALWREVVYWKDRKWMKR